MSASSINPLLKAIAAAAAFIALAQPLTGLAQAYPTKELLSTSQTVLGETIRYPTTGAARVTASIVTIAPNADTKFHRHPAPMFAYMLEGELTVDYGTAGQRVYRQGDAMVEAMDFAHRGMNLGKEIVRILVVYMGAEGTANVALEKQAPPAP